MTGTWKDADRSWDGRTVADVEAECETIGQLEATFDTLADLENDQGK